MIEVVGSMVVGVVAPLREPQERYLPSLCYLLAHIVVK